MCDFSGRRLSLSVSISIIYNIKKNLFTFSWALLSGFHRRRYRATFDCMSGLVAGAGKVTTADQVAIYLDEVQ